MIKYIAKIAKLAVIGKFCGAICHCDFLSEQCEVIVCKVEGLMADEYKAYPETLSG